MRQITSTSGYFLIMVGVPNVLTVNDHNMQHHIQEHPHRVPERHNWMHACSFSLKHLSSNMFVTVSKASDSTNSVLLSLPQRSREEVDYHRLKPQCPIFEGPQRDTYFDDHPS